MRIIILFGLLFSILASAEPIPELTKVLEEQFDQWNSALHANVSTSSTTVPVSEMWDYEQFYLQVNPFVTLGETPITLQISLQLGFLWVRDPPDGYVVFTPPTSK